MNKDSYQEVGLIIRKKRESLNVTFEEIAERFFLKKEYILMIEDGMFDEVSSFTYYYGYISILCKYLDLNEEEMLKKVKFDLFLQDVKDNDKPQASEEEKLGYIKSEIKKNNNFKWKIGLGLIIIAIYGFFKT